MCWQKYCSVVDEGDWEAVSRGIYEKVIWRDWIWTAEDQDACQQESKEVKYLPLFSGPHVMLILSHCAMYRAQLCERAEMYGKWTCSCDS
jgi:hypothetical protein